MENNTIKVFMSLIALSLLIGINGNVNAAIYKCVNAGGETYYNDKACPKSDKETQLDNVKDPIGGYIPPIFKADTEVQGAKGVVVGEGQNSTKLKKLLDDVRDRENTTSNKNSDDLSVSNADMSNNNVMGKSSSGNRKRTKPTNISKKPLQTIPLKVEKVTLEPRSKIN